MSMVLAVTATWAALLRAAGARLGTEAAASGNRAARVTAAADLFRALGGEVDVARSRGGWRLQGYGCPLSAVTSEHPEVCGLAQSMIEQIVGAEVEECCDRAGRPRCAFRIAG